MLNKLALRNWKSHTDSEYEFAPGVNIIVGSMGAGKSSIFQAITFALFGSLPEIKSRDVKTTELVNRDASATETHIKLLFSQAQEYSILRNISKKDGTGNATVRDYQDHLAAGPKPTAATAFINDLLNTDLDTFLRTVYAKQNEIDLFLKYSPADRKKYIDELMKLDKFELARKSSTMLQNKIKVRLEESQKLLETTDIHELSDNINKLTNEITNLENQKNTASMHIEKAKNNEQVLKQKLDRLRQKKTELDKLEQMLSMLNTQIEQLKIKLKDVHIEVSKQELLNKIQTLQNSLLELKSRKSEKQKQLETRESKNLSYERELAVLESKEKELSTRKEEVSRLRAEIKEIATQRPSLQSDLDSIKAKVEELNNELASKNAEVNSIIEHLAELQQAESICPVCTTKLTPETKKELIEKRKKEIIDLNKIKTETSNRLADSKRKFEELEEIAKKHKELNERITEIQKICDETASELVEKYSIIKKKSESEQNLANLKNKIKTFENKIESYQNKINQLTEQKSLYDAKDQIAKLEIQKEQASRKLAELSFDSRSLSETENQYASTLKKAQELLSQQQNIDLLINEKEIRKKELIEQQLKLSNLLETINQSVQKIEFLTKFNNALLTTQESLRIDLISTVNEVMASIWQDLYPYEKWSEIRLFASEADYRLELCDVSGDWVSVAGFASGGERMLAALSLRIAFSKVLAPHLSLLILDEPTHNLDQKAIDTFLDVLQNKLGNYLDQIFIITHDPKLAEVGNVIEV